MIKKAFAAALVALISLSTLSAYAQPDKDIYPGMLPDDPKERGSFIQNLRNVPAWQKAFDAKNRHIDTLMNNPGIHTAGITWAEDGSPIIKLFADVSASGAGLPAEVDGIPVVVENVGRVYALNVTCENRGLTDCAEFNAQAAAAQPPNQRDWHPRPVPIGVSIGHTDITAGTLGCRVSRGCHQYALSNAHVIADENDGLPGDSILQPGPTDGGIHPTDQIATLSESVPIEYGTTARVANRVDAGIAATDATMVTTVTRTNGYGTPKSATVNPSLGLLVQKYGRASALSHGYIDMLGVTVNVGYNGGAARFVDQIVIKSIDTSDFSRPGDSGALIVIDGGANDRKPVGLLFASTTDKVYTFANQINDVLAALDVDIEGE
jgi:hypothetical protein